MVRSIETKEEAKYARESAGTTTTTCHACHMVRIVESFPSVNGVLKSYFIFFFSGMNADPQASVSSGVIIQVRYSTLCEMKRFIMSRD